MMRIFIADDEDIIRDGIRNCIEKEQGKFLFAGEAPVRLFAFFSRASLAFL